ncbi:MAG: GTPase RsgA, partial [Bdellovibrionota bacterium]
MSLFNEDFLRAFGWSDFFAHRTDACASSLVGRVIGEEKNLYRVQVERERVAGATISGRMSFKARSRLDYPAVGDWVECLATGDPERLVISSVVERKSLLERAEPGTRHGRQIIATNVDWIFIATSMNQDLNAGRLDRYVALAWSSGASPVIVLTKADLSSDATSVLAEIGER